MNSRAAIRVVIVLATASAALLLTSPASAEPRPCQKALTKASAVLTKQTIKRMTKCLVKDNAGKLPGPCPDPITSVKLAKATVKAEGKIVKACTADDVTALGLGGSCSFAPDEGSTAEAACLLLPATTPAELAACVTCWQQADLYEILALLFASHAFEVCGGTLGTGSDVCSEGGCAALLGLIPDQRDLTGGDLDCQRGIAKAGFKYLVKRTKLLSKCALGGGGRQACLADPALQLKLAKAAAKTTAKIAGACRNLRPLPDAPFCCRTSGNACFAAGDRDACVTSGGQVQEGKVCGAGNRCDNVGGNKAFTWWGQCPLRNCDNFAVVDLDDLDACVRAKADETVGATLCQRLGAAGWPCEASPSGAFLDCGAGHCLLERGVGRAE